MKTGKIIECMLLASSWLASSLLPLQSKKQRSKEANNKLQVKMSHDVGEDSLQCTSYMVDQMVHISKKTLQAMVLLPIQYM
jgi:hypothetical protein